MVQEMPPENGGMSFDENGELPILQKSFSDQIRLRLRLWVIRWVIGFGIIWIVTAWSGRFDWLWTAGIVVAALSLIVTLGTAMFMQHKLTSAQQKADALGDLMKGVEAGDPK